MVEQCRYLGTTISIKNSELDLKRQMRKMYANANVLLRKFSKCSINVKCYLFKTYCSNLYCAPMWFDYTKTALKKLKVAYNNSLRRFMGLPWHNSASEMFVNLNIKSFGEMLRCFVYSFRSRIMISGNLMLIAIVLALFILIYGLGGEHYYLLTCDWPHLRTSKNMFLLLSM